MHGCGTPKKRGGFSIYIPKIYLISGHLEVVQNGGLTNENIDGSL